MVMLATQQYSGYFIEGKRKTVVMIKHRLVVMVPVWPGTRRYYRHRPGAARKNTWFDLADFKDIVMADRQYNTLWKTLAWLHQSGCLGEGERKHHLI